MNIIIITIITIITIIPILIPIYSTASHNQPTILLCLSAHWFFKNSI